uniref:Uncharacterized protein n=1 Tax=Avena sativa TaxID=4498 RepID=A0ACD5YSY6_AVESA
MNPNLQPPATASSRTADKGRSTKRSKQRPASTSHFFSKSKDGINKQNCDTLQAGFQLPAGTIIWFLHSLCNSALRTANFIVFLLILGPRMVWCTDCPSSMYDHAVNSNGAIELPLYHREHPCAKQYLNYSTSIASEKNSVSVNFTQDGSINDFLYLMPIKLGTPPIMNLVGFDTGSTLSYVQCQPCTIECHRQPPQAGPIFDPSKSTTIRRVGCLNPTCVAVHSFLGLQPSACREREDSCLYSMSYGGSSAYSVGKLVTDKLTIGLNDDASIPNFYFGCSLDTKYYQYEAGTMGFGGQPFSFFEQVSRVISYKAFSYCFPSDKKKKGYLSLGDYNHDANSTYYSTPLFLERLRSVYFLLLDKITAGGVTIEAGPSQMIVDSGSKWTLLLSNTFDQLDTQITKALQPLGYTRALYPAGPNKICFENLAFSVGNWSALPTVEVSFASGTAKLTLPPKNSFFFSPSYGLCMYFARDAIVSRGLQILGNSITLSIGITYDIQDGKFVFRNGDC